MFVQVVSLVGNMITQVFSLAFRFFNGLGAVPLIFGAFSVLTIYRFLLSPLFGHSSVGSIGSLSDKIYSGKKENSSRGKE